MGGTPGLTLVFDDLLSSCRQGRGRGQEPSLRPPSTENLTVDVGSEWLPQRDGGRLIVTTWLLASLVFMTSYSGILTAMLTLPRVTTSIDSLANQASQSDLP
ncbi:uncharacterized protein [Panulirus ornatus]|uniref:uncharacterized protein n=1 Tax=Panulirus ornatus TaxID=150431 RepID=UPI003A8C3A26